MKQPLRFMTAPKSFWDTEQLSIAAKWVAITIDSYVDNPHGTSMGVRAIQSATNLSAKEVKDAMTELYEHGAMEVTVCDGQKLWKPLLYRDSYYKNGEKMVVGDSPSDIADPIDYQLIQDTWNSVCDKLPRLDKFTARRKQKTRTCLKGASATQSDMLKVIRLVATSAFLNGSKTDWQCCYDWIIKSPDNFTKIIEGQYHKDYSEKRDYETIMHGGEVNQQPQSDDEYYR